MPSDGCSPFAARLSRLHQDLAAAALDALVVTHLPNLRYLTGFAGSAGAAVVSGGGCMLIVDARYATVARRLIAGVPDAGIDLQLVDVTYDETIAAVVRRLDVPRTGIEAASMSVGRFNRIAAAVGDGCLVPVERLIERRRAVKDAVEIDILREAARRLSEVARQMPAFVRAGRSERAVAAEIDFAVRGAGFERPAFDTIVASGPNSALPHARAGERRLAAAEGVVLDFGGVYDGYCVDLTRTLQVGAAGTEWRGLFAAVREAHGAAIAAVRPGARPSEIDGAAREVLTRHGLAEAFGHGTGHGLGLEVHEDPRITKLPAARPDEPVCAGMVFTIEPGAYVEGLGGVRIEDDVLVVPNGCEVLTDVPIDLQVP